MAAGIEPAERGRLEVNENFQTSVDHIYAVGDIIGFPALAATSMEQGRRASYHAFGESVGGKLGDLQPIGIYSIPEISYVGRTEKQLTSENVPFEVGVSRYRELARGAILGDSYGILKLLVHAESRELLGVHVFGTNATELVHIGQMVMGCGGTVDFLVDAVFNYPTLAESYKVAALDAVNKMRAIARVTQGLAGSDPAGVAAWLRSWHDRSFQRRQRSAGHRPGGHRRRRCSSGCGGSDGLPARNGRKGPQRRRFRLLQPAVLAGRCRSVGSSGSSDHGSGLGSACDRDPGGSGGAGRHRARVRWPPSLDLASRFRAVQPTRRPRSGLTTERAAILVEVYRRAGVWKIRNVSAGWAAGLPAWPPRTGSPLTKPRWIRSTRCRLRSCRQPRRPYRSRVPLPHVRLLRFGAGSGGVRPRGGTALPEAGRFSAAGRKPPAATGVHPAPAGWLAGAGRLTADVDPATTSPARRATIGSVGDMMTRGRGEYGRLARSKGVRCRRQTRSGR